MSVDESGFGGDSGANSFGDTFLTSENTGSTSGPFGSGSSDSGSDDNSVITARGTGDGLVLRLDGRIQLHALKAALLSYVETRQGFLVGQEVIFEWLGARPEEGVVAELTQILSSRFGVLVKASRMAERQHSSSKGEHSSSFLAPSVSVTKSENSKSDRSYADKNLSSDKGLVEKPIPLAPQKGLAGNVEGKQTSYDSDERHSHSSDAFKNSSEAYKPKLSPVDGERFDRVSRVSPASGTSLFDGLNPGSSATGLPVTGLANGASGNEGRMSEARGIGAGFGIGSGSGIASMGGAGVINESLLWDDPDTRIIRQTLRSGQKIESEFSLVINGDVNSGAEVVAGGDVIVLGKLRGVVHAGAFEESGRGRFIFAVQMQPTQLRIGSVISRGTKEDSSGGPEIARVEGTMISVESFMKNGNATNKKRW